MGLNAKKRGKVKFPSYLNIKELLSKLVNKC